MAVFVRDNFIDTNGVLLQNHTGETGASWTKHPAVAYPLDMQIESNRAESINTATGAGAYFASGVPPSANYKVRSAFYIEADAGYIYVAGRMHTTDDTMYFLEYEHGTNQWNWKKRVAGVTTSLASYAQVLTVGQSYPFEIYFIGNTAIVEIEGVERMRVHDTDITAAGRVGVRYYQGSQISAKRQIEYLIAEELDPPSDLQDKNFAKSTLAGDITATANQLTAASGEGAKFPQSGEFKAVLWSAAFSTPEDDPNREVVTLELSSGDIFDIKLRGGEDTTAKAWNTDDNVAHTITAERFAFANIIVRSSTLKVAADDAYGRTKDHADLVCDGAADDAEINEALESLPAAGGEVLLSEGNFEIGSSVSEVTNNRNLAGMGIGATLLNLAAGAETYVITNKNTSEASGGDTIGTIRDMTVNGNKAGQVGTYAGIFLQYVRMFSLRNLEVKNASDRGLEVQGQGASGLPHSRFYLIDGIYAHDNAQAGVAVAFAARMAIATNIIAWDNGGAGVTLDVSEFVASNIIGNNNLYGIYLRNFVGGSLNNVAVTRNKRHGLWVLGMTNAQGDNWRAQGNSQEAADTYDEIYFDDSDVESYGITKNATIGQILAGSDDGVYPTVNARYGMYFGDGFYTPNPHIKIAQFMCRTAGVVSGAVRWPTSGQPTNIVIEHQYSV